MSTWMAQLGSTARQQTTKQLKEISVVWKRKGGGALAMLKWTPATDTPCVSTVEKNKRVATILVEPGKAKRRRKIEIVCANQSCVIGILSQVVNMKRQNRRGTDNKVKSDLCVTWFTAWRPTISSEPKERKFAVRRDYNLENWTNKRREK